MGEPGVVTDEQLTIGDHRGHLRKSQRAVISMFLDTVFCIASILGQLLQQGFLGS
jgi:hypothetical protein